MRSNSASLSLGGGREHEKYFEQVRLCHIIVEKHCPARTRGSSNPAPRGKKTSRDAFRETKDPPQIQRQDITANDPLMHSLISENHDRSSTNRQIKRPETPSLYVVTFFERFFKPTHTATSYFEVRLFPLTFGPSSTLNAHAGKGNFRASKCGSSSTQRHECHKKRATKNNHTAAVYAMSTTGEIKLSNDH